LITRTKLYVNLCLGSERIFWTDPQKVRFRVGTNGPATEAIKLRIDRLRQHNRLFDRPLRLLSRVIYHPPPLSHPGANRDREAPPASGGPARAPEPSARFALVQAALPASGAERSGKPQKIVLRSRASINAFLRDYILGLVDSLATSGYDPARASDTGSVLIGPDGDIHKANNGNHRFCAARIVGCPRVPVKIAGMHEDWFVQTVGSQMNLMRLRAALLRWQSALPDAAISMQSASPRS
jgi:hypothetical protein